METKILGSLLTYEQNHNFINHHPITQQELNNSEYNCRTAYHVTGFVVKLR
ncbi:hypothetical protein Smp_166750 [Schistosoma mansoni]|uniref:Uncharacterized protein n=1 Tax=Schistosoma mansoni TaxID=6183 RepID=G4VN34_SCHMA|nr:hypothetical protein Smp_166750 [Schistosoma mansoni]|eukprot:XP_018653669.1 hypothetical protein Smp_166750 [Schistosoma mansoni]